MLMKPLSLIFVAATLTGCQTALNEPTDAYVKRTVESNAPTMASRVSATAETTTSASPNS